MHASAYGNDFQSDVDAVQQIPAVPTILDVVCRVTGMGFAAVARVTEGRWIACGVKDTIGFGLQPGGELKVDTTICHEIEQHRQPVIISHVAEDLTYCKHPAPEKYGFQSYISTPILLPDGAFFGTLCAIDPKPRPLDSQEVVGSFKLFAELIAFHLDAHAQIVRSETALSDEREVSTLREQFIAVLGHDLRSPLQAVSAGAQAMVRHPERASELAAHVDRSVARMAGLIDDVTDFARGRMGGGLKLRLGPETRLTDTLDQVIQELQSTQPDRVIVREFALEAPVRCDEARVAQVLSNLLGNALMHGASATPIRVTAASGCGAFELAVSNQGEPIPEALLPKLFQPFIRGVEDSPAQGLGLGLYIASEIARAHGGNLSATSTPDETRFVFRIPSGLVT